MVATIIIESDVKACIEALLSPANEVSWRISFVFVDTLSWASHSLFHGFKWIPRKGNKAVHILASCCSRNNFSICFVVGSTPSPFMDIILLEQTHFVSS